MIRRFIEGLEATELPQTRYSLRDERGFCCLGVAATEIFDLATPTELDNFNHSSTYTRLDNLLGDVFTEYCVSLNDVEGLTFAQIAKTLRQEYLT